MEEAHALAWELLANGLLSQEQLEQALELLRQSPPGTELRTVLLEQDFLTSEQLAGAGGATRAPISSRRTKIEPALPEGVGSFSPTGETHDLSPRPPDEHTAFTDQILSLPEISEGGAYAGPTRSEIDAALADPLRRRGRYVLIRELGRGGMGAVTLAYDTSARRLVALKTLIADFSTTHQQRLQREAESLGVLHHPAIAQVHDLVREGPGAPYMVSAYIPGAPLSQVANRLTPRRAAELLRELADAVAHAHSAGVLHRDIKPGNIIITPQGCPVLLDFGLAKRELGDSDEKPAVLTHTGQVLGTPAYMAPEQIEDSKNAGPLADIYGLGSTLYYALTDQAPFEGAGTVQSLLGAVLHQKPIEPRRLRPEIPLELQSICLKCLEKDPTARYPDGEALRDALEGFLAGRPIHAGTAARGWALSGVAALVLLTVFGVSSGLQGDGPTNERASAAIPAPQESTKTPTALSASLTEPATPRTTGKVASASEVHPRLRALAEAGDAQAMRDMCEKLLYGNDAELAEAKRRLLTASMAGDGAAAAILASGVLARILPGDRAAALASLERAAAASEPDALRLLSVYLISDEVAAGGARAVRLLERGRAMGDAGATAQLAFMLAEGMGVRRDLPRSVMLYREAAEKGYGSSMVRLADAYMKGNGVPVDYSQSRRWLERARKTHEEGPALNLLAEHYNTGLGVPRDFTKAVALYRRSGKLGHSHGYVGAGYLIERGLGARRDPHEAARLYRLAAEGKNAIGMNNLGVLLILGSPGLERDPKRGVVWLKRSVDSGSELGAYNLADFLERGQELEQDLGKARTYYEIAARAGYPPALERWGAFLAEGIGGPVDLEGARLALERAATSGNTRGMARYGRFLVEAKGALADPKAGRSWLRRAAAAGDQRARKLLGTLDKQEQKTKQ